MLLCVSVVLRFRRRRRKLSRLDDGLKTLSVMVPIAERLVLGHTAPAKRDLGASGQAEFFPLPVLNDEVARNTKRSVWKYSDIGRIGHEFDFSSATILIRRPHSSRRIRRHRN